MGKGRQRGVIGTGLAVVSAHLFAATAFAANGAEAGGTAGTDGESPSIVIVTGIRAEGYKVDSSSTGTRTNAELRDVPQSITVIPSELIRDQSMQSMTDVIRYVPGVGTSQGENNRDTVVLRGTTSTSDFYVNGVRDDVQYFRDLYNVDAVDRKSVV